MASVFEWQLSRMASVPNGKCPKWQVGRMATLPNGKCPEWQLSHGKCPEWQVSEWQVGASRFHKQEKQSLLGTIGDYQLILLNTIGKEK